MGCIDFVRDSNEHLHVYKCAAFCLRRATPHSQRLNYQWGRSASDGNLSSMSRYWHCRRSSVYVTVGRPSVRPSVRLSVPQQPLSIRSCSGTSGRRYRTIVAMVGYVPSVLWRRWLGDRKGIRPVEKEWWPVGCWHGCVWSELQTCICPSWCHCHSLSLA